LNSKENNFSKCSLKDQYRAKNNTNNTRNSKQNKNVKNIITPIKNKAVENDLFANTPKQVLSNSENVNLNVVISISRDDSEENTKNSELQLKKIADPNAN